MVSMTNGDLSSTEYARRRKALFELTKCLKALGADTIIRMPRIAVIGGQSAGKSSLVEAVTRITVPRDSGTCTRCPMECSISASGTTTWTCQISLKLQYDGNQPRGTTTTIPFGPKILDKQHVETQIRRAQAAILSPHHAPESFLQRSVDELRDLINSDPDMKQFSRNAVVVDIEDPNGTDLFFVDLPGLIQNADQEEIDIVKDLVVDYIAEDQTIILVTIPVSDDIENQQAVKLAREADPDGTRTIGVLTKPDTLTVGAINARKKWKELLLGQSASHSLKLGYYCVRLAEDSERAGNISREAMDQRASVFFKATPPWSEVYSHDRLGIPNLVRDLSKMLMHIIEESLPRLKAELQQNLEQCLRDLDQLPTPIIVDPATEILNRITNFCRDLQDAIYGRSTNKEFIHKNRAAYQLFKLDIRETAPDFRPSEDHKKYIKPTMPDSLAETEEEFPSSLDSTKKRAAMQPMDLFYVRRVIKESIGWELPRNIPYQAKVVLYKTFLDLWDTPAHECYATINQHLQKLVTAQISSHFKRFKQLENHIKPIVHSRLASVSEEGRKALDEVLSREKSPLFTQNTHYLNSVYVNWLAFYRYNRHHPMQELEELEELEEQFWTYGARSARSNPSPSVSRSPDPRTVLQLLNDMGYPGLDVNDLARLHPTDGFEDELAVMADVRAYFQVSYKRIIDHVPLTIQLSLNQVLADSLQGYLINELDLGKQDASQRFHDLLAEDPDNTTRRDYLESRKKQMLDIQQKLNKF